MSRSSNSLRASDTVTTPIKLKYTSSYDSSSLNNYGITVVTGVNGPISITGSVPQETLTYRSVRHLYYSNFLTGSNPAATSSFDNFLQSTAARGTLDADIRNFPTASEERIVMLSIPRSVAGEKISRGGFRMTSSAYSLTDDGNGNIVANTTTGSKGYSTYGSAYGINGVRLFDPGYTPNETGTYKSWNCAAVGGSYLGTFWANPYQNSTDGRLNSTGFWSAEGVSAIGTGVLEFTLSIPSTNTYHIGVSCDNFSSVYVDNLLVVGDYSTFSSNNYRYWDIFPLQLTAGSHIIKLIGTNNDERPANTVNNPGLMGIEVYNNTNSQISASITAAPLGTSTPAGLNLTYSSKDHLTEGVFSRVNKPIGNIIYPQGMAIITDSEFLSIFEPITTTTTTTSTTTSTTTALPTTTSTTTVAPTTTSTTTVAPTTTSTTTVAPTTTSTTTVAPTTTSTTTSTTTAAPTTTTSTTTTAPTTTSTTTAPTTTSTTTSTTTVDPNLVYINWSLSEVGSGAVRLVVTDSTSTVIVNQVSVGTGTTSGFVTTTNTPYSFTVSVDSGTQVAQWRLCNDTLAVEITQSYSVPVSQTYLVDPTPISTSIFATYGDTNTPLVCGA